MQDKKWSARLYTMTAAPARKADILFWIIAGFAILTISIIYNRFGLLHFELRNYIPYHLAPRLVGHCGGTKQGAING